MITVSVIIPCFNHGKYFDEAVESVLNQTYDSFEIIVINDGSTDRYTIDKLNSFSKPKTHIIHTENRGLSHARNIGIKNAKGIYILPLDADDKIANTYIKKAVSVFEDTKNVGIVYCDAYLFGSPYQEGIWNLPPYSLENILINNMIFASAFFRRSDWEKVGGYDEEMKHGNEDHDFWLKLIELGVTVYKIPEVLFYYRRLGDSMVHRITDEQDLNSRIKMFYNNKKLYIDNYVSIIKRITLLERQIRKMQEDKVIIFIKRIKLYGFLFYISDLLKISVRFMKNIIYIIKACY